MPDESLMTHRPLLYAILCMTLFVALPVGAIAAQRTVDVRRAVTSTASIRISGAFADLRTRGWSKDSIALTGTIPSDASFAGGFLTSASGPSSGAKYYLETTCSAPSGKLELRVPAGARVWARRGSATIDVDGV